jgi:hypothetical protein
VIFVRCDLHDIGKDASTSRHEKQPDKEYEYVGLSEVLGKCTSDHKHSVSTSKEYHGLLPTNDIRPMSEEKSTNSLANEQARSLESYLVAVNTY